MRDIGQGQTFLFSPEASSSAAIDAAWPMQMVVTSFLTYCMVS